MMSPKCQMFPLDFLDNFTQISEWNTLFCRQKIIFNTLGLPVQAWKQYVLFASIMRPECSIPRVVLRAVPFHRQSFVPMKNMSTHLSLGIVTVISNERLHCWQGRRLTNTKTVDVGPTKDIVQTVVTSFNKIIWKNTVKGHATVRNFSIVRDLLYTCIYFCVLLDRNWENVR